MGQGDQVRRHQGGVIRAVRQIFRNARSANRSLQVVSIAEANTGPPGSAPSEPVARQPCFGGPELNALTNRRPCRVKL